MDLEYAPEQQVYMEARALAIRWQQIQNVDATVGTEIPAEDFNAMGLSINDLLRTAEYALLEWTMRQLYTVFPEEAVDKLRREDRAVKEALIAFGMSIEPRD
jgi:hypothetical protein